MYLTERLLQAASPAKLGSALPLGDETSPDPFTPCAHRKREQKACYSTSYHPQQHLEEGVLEGARG